ncbi:hypothetical protein KXQ82_09110 [Mucilaginibacter sp. HMF5004]|uniref:hypothetical protein n=1 Tax=Mucilaginibacter rivuli TaxID=2857527 RepID=UPI001C5E77F3|nr:hypothetical protein [Mucilaginibacter rivuli]MBW4889874.1 hypothetical protein [Mucilaginibacter rivuli]
MRKHQPKRYVILGIATLFVIITAAIGIKSVFFPKNSIDVKDVEIKLPSGNNTVKIGASKESVITALGKPKQVSSFSSQANYKQGTVLNYDGDKFYFVHNKLTDFELTSHKYKVSLGSVHKYMAVGTPSNELPHYKILQNAALLDVKDSDLATNQFLEYDLSDSGKVTKIVYSDY